MDNGKIQQILTTHFADPFALLGMHRQGDGLVVRLFLPRAQAVAVVDLQAPQLRYRATRVHDEGVFCVEIADRGQLFAYELEVKGEDGVVRRQRRPSASRA